MSIADKFKTVAQKMEDVYRTGLFKYAPKATASGESIFLENSAPEPFVNMIPYGKSWQNGTPSPTNPIPIESAKEVKVLGGNLLYYPYSESTTTKNGLDFIDNGDGSISIKGTATADTWYNFAHNGSEINLDAGTYRISANGLVDGMTMMLHDTLTDNYYGYSIPITLNEATRCNIFIQVFSGTTIDTNIYPMLNIGDVALPYEPYTEQTLALPNLYEGDVVYYSSKKIVRHSKVIRLADLEWYQGGINYDGDGHIFYTPYVSLPDYDGVGYCTHLKRNNNYVAWEVLAYGECFIVKDGVIICTQHTSTEELMAWLELENVEVIYKSTEPIETDLTDAEIYALKRLRANSPNTTIVGQGQVDVTYIVDNR